MVLSGFADILALLEGKLRMNLARNAFGAIEVCAQMQAKLRYTTVQSYSQPGGEPHLFFNSLPDLYPNGKSSWLV
jgi:hypothetical protein